MLSGRKKVGFVLVEAPPRRRGGFFVAAKPERKECVVDLDHKATGDHSGSERSNAQGNAMQKNQRVGEMAVDVLARQAGTRAKRTGEPFEEALKAVLETEAGQQLGELRDGPHREERAQDWHEDLLRERKRERAEERKRVERAAEWEQFMQGELRELELRKGGQLAELLGDPLPGESPTAVRRLASEDQRQAQEGLVALMRGGKVLYKHVDELTSEDMPARVAANRLRMSWLKERRDGWLGRPGR